MIIPSLVSHALPRPERYEFEVPYLVPNENLSFWKKVYDKLHTLDLLSPFNESIDTCIDREIGYFGYRSHPSDPNKQYYHIGIQLDLPAVFDITPVMPGILEYSGYGAINGYYVLLSHPEIQTEDGYVLHTMYCHLKKPLIQFNSYQKMLREISLGSYPEIEVSTETLLGFSGSSGVVKDGSPTLYIQIDFRKYGETPIAVDPHMMYTKKTSSNSSVDL